MNQNKLLKGFLIVFFTVWLGVIAIVIIEVIATPVAHFTRKTYTVQITDKEVKRNGDSDHYLVYGKVMKNDGTTETRTFTIQDSLMEGKFRSSDLYGSIERGHTYVIKTYGWRIPILSAYENIISIAETE